MSEEKSNNQSHDDQNNGGQVSSKNQLDKKTVMASALLLLAPSAIPLLFVGQAESAGNVGLLVGLSAVVLLFNVFLLFMLLRWFKQLRDG